MYFVCTKHLICIATICFCLFVPHDVHPARVHIDTIPFHAPFGASPPGIPGSAGEATIDDGSANSQHASVDAGVVLTEYNYLKMATRKQVWLPDPNQIGLQSTAGYDESGFIGLLLFTRSMGGDQR
jgi:hypothetical protein